MALGRKPIEIVEEGKHQLLTKAKHWKRIYLGEVAKIQNGYAFSSKNFSKHEGIPLIRIRDINNVSTVDRFNGEYSNEFIVKKGDILVGMDGDFNAAYWKGEDALLNQRVCKIIPNSEIYNDRFLFFCLQPYLNAIHAETSAVTVKHISSKTIEEIPLPYPPIEEQKAIVSKIEELLSELDQGIADLKTAQAQLKVYRQSVLKWAFEGKLTNENVKEGELPEGWKETKIIDICDNIKVGIVIQPKRYYSKTNSGIKAFRSANVRELHINDNDWVYFSQESNEINYRTKLKEGDVLLVRSGYPGTSCVVSKNFEGSNAIDILIATPNKKEILPEYLCYFNNSPLGKGMFKAKSRGVAQKHLNVGEYSKLLIRIPSLEQQLFIIHEIESRLSVADKMEESIAQSLQQAEALRQSILKKAFSGELV